MIFSRTTPHPKIVAVIRWLCVLGLAVWFSTGSVHAQPTPDGELQIGVITSIRQFWNLSAEERTRSHSYRIECDVLFYDAAWKNLWIHDGAEGAYAAVGATKLPVASGQRVVVTGTFEPPNQDLSLATATVLSARSSNVIPLAAVGSLFDAERFQNQLTTMEGLVVRQSRLDSEHLFLTLDSEGGTVFAYAIVDPTKTVPDFVDSTVRLRGVYVMAPSQGAKKSVIEMRVPGGDDITILNWLGSDPRFKIETSPIDALRNLPRENLVRVTGQVIAQEQGRFLRIRDETGQVDLLTGQIRTCAINERVEAIGFPGVEGSEWKLEQALFRSLSTPFALSPGTPNSVLRVSAQVLELTPDEAAAGRPVLLSGVVTWSHPDSPLMFVQDASGGICVSRGELKGRPRGIGQNIQIKGSTAMGAFAPIVVASEMVKIRDTMMPEARQVSLELAQTGVEEAQWVEMRGYLRKVEGDQAWTRLELTTAAGNFRAELPAGKDLTALEGSVIRIHGVCTAESNARRKLTGIKMLVPSAAYVQVEETAPEDLFAQPARLLANLGQFGTLRSFNRRVKVSGVVLHHSPGHFIDMVEGDESLRVVSRQTSPLLPGARVDAVGFLGRQSGRAVLREAVYRQTSMGDEPEVQMLAQPYTIRKELDGHLVQVDATLIDESLVGEQFRLTLQSENAIFEAYLERAAAGDRVTTLLVGSKLRLTGVYETKYADDGLSGAFLLRLRSSENITVVARPSSLTRGRILMFAAALGAGILLFTAWVVVLRRRVQQQTAQIRAQLEREARLETELQRATKLESLGLLAGGIAHDFNNLLTVVMGNISLAMLDLKRETESTSWLREAERAVARARDLTQQLLTFAKGGAPLRTAVVLADVVKEVAQCALRGSNTRCVFQIADDLSPADVDKGQIGQVVQNIVINGMQAMPEGGRITITLQNETVDPAFGKILAPGRYVKLSIADTGAGIAPEHLGRMFEPYFTTKKTGNGLGLATVYSIVKKHLGHITVESALGRGTVFHIWLPAAATAAAATVEPPPPGQPGQGRVLFMDDDEEIRRLGSAMLRRLGYKSTAVTDGAEAVAEYRRRFRGDTPYDFVILDLTIPGGMGGRETVQKLLEIDPGVKAIVSSGYSNDEVLANYQRYGFHGIVTKPYETATLARSLDLLRHDVVN